MKTIENVFMVSNRYKMLPKGAHNMKKSINTHNSNKIKRDSMTIIKGKNQILKYVP